MWLLGLLLAPEAAAPVDALPMDPGVVRGRLDNGIQTLIEPAAVPEGWVEIRVVVPYGGIDDNGTEHGGMAHLIEHVVLDGKPPWKPHHRFSASLGINGATTLLGTTYKLTIAERRGSLEHPLNWMASWFANTPNDPEVLDSARRVVTEEWRNRESSGAGLYDGLIRLLAGDTPLFPDNATLPDRLEDTGIFEVQQAFEQGYHPSSMWVLIAGDVDADRVQKQLQRTFGQLEVAWDPTPRVTLFVDEDQTLRTEVLTDPRLVTTRLSFGAIHDEVQGSSAAGYRRILVRSMLSRILDERLSDAAHANLAIVHTASRDDRLTPELRLFTAYASVDEASIPEAVAVLATVLEQARSFGIREDEVARARQGVAASYASLGRRGRQETAAERISELVRHAEQEEGVPGLEKELALARQHLPTITAEELQDELDSWLSGPRRALLLSGPPGRVAPPETPLTTLWQQAVANTTEPPAAVAPPSLHLDPTPGKIADKLIAGDDGLHRWRLSNGAQVLVKVTEDHDPIAFTSVRRGGTHAADDEAWVSAELAADIVNDSGVGPLSGVDLERLYRSSDLSLWAYSTRTTLGLSGVASAAELERMVQLAHLFHTAPRFDAKALESQMLGFRQYLRNRTLDPDAQLEAQVQAASWQNHPRFRSWDEGDLDTLDLRLAKAFFHDQMSAAQHFTFVFVGQIDLDALERLAVRYLASLPATDAQISWYGHGIGQATGGHTLEVASEMPASRVIARFPLAIEGDAAPTPAELAFLEGLVGYRLTLDLRNVRNLVYTVGAETELVRGSGLFGSLTIDVTCAPENLELVRRIIVDRLDRIEAGDVDEADLRMAWERARFALQGDDEDNSYWMRMLLGAELAGASIRDYIDDATLGSRARPNAMRNRVADLLSGSEPVVGIRSGCQDCAFHH